MSKREMLNIKDSTNYLNNVLLSMSGVSVDIGEWEVLERIESGDLPTEKRGGKYYVDRGYLNEIIGEIHLGLVEDLLIGDEIDDNEILKVDELIEILKEYKNRIVGFGNFDVVIFGQTPDDNGCMDVGFPTEVGIDPTEKSFYIMIDAEIL